MDGCYYSLNEYMKKTFGEKVYKLSLDLDLTCPNRDGTLDTRGCIFCHNGSSHFAACDGDLSQRLEAAKALVAKKTDARLFVAYFQSFTNTYAPIDYLRKCFHSVIIRPEIVAISVATRPDCLPDEVLQLLCELNKIKPVWVELGLQTANEKTAEYIRRCYKNDIYVQAVKKLRDINVEVVTHIILGLPDETLEDMLASVDLAIDSSTTGIKLQLLHVLRDTDLCTDFENGRFATMTLEEYTETLFACIRRIPKDIVIHRITGDAPKKYLVAPTWSADKKRVLNHINHEMKRQSLRQGSDVKTAY